MLAFVFPGQGAQTIGMGRDLFDSICKYSLVETDIDQALGYSLRKLCLEGPEEKLKATEFTQPCLYIVNALHYYQIAGENHPSYVAGHSLGEYNALLAAGVFDLITGLKLVQRRGEIMAQAKNGGMAAIIGLSMDRVLSILREEDFSELDIANYNAEAQVVISGSLSDIKRAKSIFEMAGARMYLPLSVGGAFHSRYMKEAARSFNEFLKKDFIFNEPKIPVISNVTARPYPPEDPTNSVISLLTQQIFAPVRWLETIQYLLRLGISDFKEVGPGTVLTRLIQQINQ